MILPYFFSECDTGLGQCYSKFILNNTGAGIVGALSPTLRGQRAPPPPPWESRLVLALTQPCADFLLSRACVMSRACGIGLAHIASDNNKCNY